MNRGGDRLGIGDVELQRDRLALFALDEIGDRQRIAAVGDETEAVRQRGAGEFAGAKPVEQPVTNQTGASDAGRGHGK